MTNLAEQVIRVGIDYASKDVRVAGALIAAGLVLGAAGWVWTRWKSRKAKNNRLD